MRTQVANAWGSLAELKPDAPQDGSRAPYPLIVFGHGYSTQPDAYMSTLQHLASWGHIVVAPEVPAVSERVLKRRACNVAKQERMGREAFLEEKRKAEADRKRRRKPLGAPS